MKIISFLKRISWQNAQSFLLVILLSEFSLFVFSGVSFSFLYGALFFEFGVDPFFWIIYFTGIPQFIVSHQWVGIILDIGIAIFLLELIRNPYSKRIAQLLFVLLILFYVTLMGYLNHRNYHVGFFIVLIPFFFKIDKSRILAFEAIRYYLLFFYISAAFLKLYYNTLGDINHFSGHLMHQFKPYFIEGNTGLRTNINFYLINHPPVSYSLFLASVIAEFIVFIGFFTYRFDKILCIILLLFHFVNWFIMDIAPIGQITFICVLFLSSYFKGKGMN